MIKFGILISSFFIFFNSIASDLTIGPVITSPTSGCNLTSTELVTITVINASPTAYSGSFVVGYILNGAVTTETITVPVLPTSATYIYQFSGSMDLSNCGIHTIQFFVDDPADIDNTNDSITATVTNDCSALPGTFTGPLTVCTGTNVGNIVLNGNTGVILDWEDSVDNGLNWGSLSNTTNTQSYLNITDNTTYKVIYSTTFNLCPIDSIIHTITIDSLSNAGILSSDSTHCDTILPSVLYLNNYLGSVLNYQFSLNNGITWSNYNNPFDTLEYTEFGSNFQFFAIVQNGVCPSDSSNTVTINLIPGSNAGTIISDDSICEGISTANLETIGFNGNVLNWEYSTNNGVNWNSFSTSSNPIQVTNLTVSSDFRVIVKEGACPSDTSFFHIHVIDNSDAGIISGSAIYCNIINSGNISTTGYTGIVTDWISTTNNGGSFTSLNTTNDLIPYTNLSNTTGYAVIVQNLGCTPDTSDIIYITINTSAIAGQIYGIDTICPFNESFELNIDNYVGNITTWESSVDNGLSWLDTEADTNKINIQSINENTLYRVIIQLAGCENDTAFKTVITHNTLNSYALEDTIFLGETIQLNAQGGISYAWNPNMYIDNYLTHNPVVSPEISITYDVDIIDSNSCVINSTHSIIVIENPSKLYPSNIITPNGDGINDTWIIKNIELFKDNAVYVFDSYGQIIYNSSPYTNNWDLNGNTLPNGTYFYTIFSKPEAKPVKGTFTIIGVK